MALRQAQLAPINGKFVTITSHFIEPDTKIPERSVCVKQLIESVKAIHEYETHRDTRLPEQT